MALSERDLRVIRGGGVRAKVRIELGTKRADGFLIESATCNGLFCGALCWLPILPVTSRKIESSQIGLITRNSNDYRFSIQYMQAVRAVPAELAANSQIDRN